MANEAVTADQQGRTDPLVPKNKRRIPTSLWGAVFLGILVILVFAFAQGFTFAFEKGPKFSLAEGVRQGLMLGSYALFLAGVAAMIGALIGFLFGMPVPRPEAREAAAANAANGSSQNQNTSVQQISDWLTKIIVGVGLTQLGSVPAGVKALAKAISPPFGSTDYAKPLSISIVIYFAVSGFIFGYLMTRFFMPEPPPTSEEKGEQAQAGVPEPEATSSAQPVLASGRDAPRAGGGVDRGERVPEGDEHRAAKKGNERGRRTGHDGTVAPSG